MLDTLTKIPELNPLQKHPLFDHTSIFYVHSKLLAQNPMYSSLIIHMYHLHSVPESPLRLSSVIVCSHISLSYQTASLSVTAPPAPFSLHFLLLLSPAPLYPSLLCSLCEQDITCEASNSHLYQLKHVCNSGRI